MHQETKKLENTDEKEIEDTVRKFHKRKKLKLM